MMAAAEDTGRDRYRYEKFPHLTFPHMWRPLLIGDRTRNLVIYPDRSPASVKFSWCNANAKKITGAFKRRLFCIGRYFALNRRQMTRF